MNDSSTRQRDRVVALAALLQAVSLVQQIAETGQVDQLEFEVLLKSLAVTDAASTEAVYGDLTHLKMGFLQLNKQLSKSKIIFEKQNNFRKATPLSTYLHNSRIATPSKIF